MDIRFVRTGPPPAMASGPPVATSTGPVDDPVSRHELAELPALLTRTDGIVWVDIPEWDGAAEATLTDVFCFHPLAVADCRERRQVPKVHVYPDHVFVVLHAPSPGAAGHVHYVELDQFVGPNYLVTVHGPLNPAVDPDEASVEVRAALRRLSTGRFRPQSPYEISYALVSALCGRLREYTAALTADVWDLEKRVTGGHLGDVEQFLEELFRARHGLITVRTMASLSREVYARMARINVFGTKRGHRLLQDTVDQFDRLAAMAHSQKDYLQGTIEFYQTRTNTKMTIAAERLAVIAAVTLPITALSSVLGMNLIVNEETHYVSLGVTLLIMIVMSITLLIWAKRKGWW